jgi:hypothetical protein
MDPELLFLPYSRKYSKEYKEKNCQIFGHPDFLILIVATKVNIIFN